MKFKTTIIQTGNNTGIEVSDQILDQLGSGKKPLVVVTLNGYSYRSAVGKMGSRFMISLSAENRKNAGVSGGDLVEINLELDTEPRTVEVPTELQKIFKENKSVKFNFEKLSPSKRKAIVISINEAKTEETKMKRIQKAIEQLMS
ncbi:MAG TPA: YdeI/OmpD-associated family protein [Saprospiraceae bacterium]|nr:YdeI/OmpD-associated family protein [Saprospiraceae bacterium]